MTVSPRAVVGGVVVVVVVLAAWRLWPRAEQTPEEQIRLLVSEMAKAAEKKDLGFLLDHVSARFKSSEGWSKDDVKGVLAAQILGGQWVRVIPVDVEVEMDGSEMGHVKTKLILARSDATDWRELLAQSRGEAHGIDGAVQLEDGVWRFVTASHRSLAPAELVGR